MADNFATMNFVYEEKRPVKVDPVDSHQWRSLGEEGLQDSAGLPLSHPWITTALGQDGHSQLIPVTNW